MIGHKHRDGGGMCLIVVIIGNDEIIEGTNPSVVVFRLEFRK